MLLARFACVLKFFYQALHLLQLIFKVAELGVGLLAESEDVLQEVEDVGVEFKTLYTGAGLFESSVHSLCQFLQVALQLVQIVVGLRFLVAQFLERAQLGLCQFVGRLQSEVGVHVLQVS